MVGVASFALAPVLLSHDVYSYLDYARLGVVHGLDPYVQPPFAAPADPAYAKVEWTETTSAYGPLFTLATYPLAWLPVGVAVAALKAAAALSVLGLAAVVSRIAAWRGADPLRAAAFVALNPLVLVHVVGGAHNDGLAMLLALLAVAALLSAREASAGASLVAAVAIKASTAFLAPFALVATLRPAPTGLKAAHMTGNRPVGRQPFVRLLAGGLGAAVAVAAVAYLAFGWDWLHAFGLAGENQGRTSYMSIPITIARLSGLDPDAVRLTALVLFLTLVLELLLWTWRGFDWVRACRLDRRRPAPSHRLAAPLVPSLAPPPGRYLPRPPPSTTGPRPHRLPTRRPHPPLTRARTCCRHLERYAHRKTTALDEDVLRNR